MATGTEIGNSYGAPLSDFTTDSQNVIEKIVIAWCNARIITMRGVIRAKSRTGGASVLAQSIAISPVKKTPVMLSLAIVTDQDYFDYVDKGVRGLKGNSAPKSKYRFRNLGTPKKMIDSFKKYIAATGSRGLDNKKLIRKNKKKQADLINEQAKKMAMYTKIGGIKPMGYIKAAINTQTKKELSDDLSIAIRELIKVSITNSIK